MRLKLGVVKNKRLLIIALALALIAGGGITKALLGGTSSPVSSSDIELQRGLIGWWKMDGNAKDSTPGSNNGTVNNATLTADREGGSNSAYSFNATNAYIALPDGAYNTLTAGSLSAWVKLTANPGAGAGYSIFTSASSTGIDNLIGIGVYGVTGSDTRFRIGENSPTVNYVYGNTTLTAGNWYHLVATATGSTWQLYVNGALQTLSVQQGSNVGYFFNQEVSGTQHYDIGVLNRSSGFSGYFNGQIDDMRVYNRVLSASEVSTLSKEYNTGLNLSSGENSLVGWWKFDGNAKDATPNADDGVLSGTSATTDREGQSARALSFNGTTDNVTITDNPLLHVSPNLTVSFWVKEDSLTNKTGCCEAIVTKEASATNRNFNIYVNRTTGVVVGSSSFGGIQFDLSSSTNIFDSKWHLVTYVISGTLQQIYVDGVFKNSHTNASNVDTQSNNVIFSPSGAFQGELDDARIYSRALSATDVVTLYKSYDSQISLYQNSSGGVNLGSSLLGEWDFNGNAKDSSPYANNGTVTGAVLSADRKGRANSAYTLGDSNAWINVGSPSTYSNLSSGLTYNIWLMRTTSSVAHWPEIMGASNTHIYYGIRSQNFGDSIDFEYATSPYAGSTFSGTAVQSLPVNQWHMFTVTYDGSTLKTYWDSSLKSTASSVALNPAFGGLQFTASTSGFAGSVDDARVWGRALSQAEVTSLYTQYR